MVKKILCAGVLALALTCGSVAGMCSEGTVIKAAEDFSLGVLDEWEKEAPDFYGGMSYKKGTDLYYVYLKDNTEENQKTVTDGIPKSVKVVFITCNYSRNELLKVQSEIANEIKNYAGIQSYGIGIENLETGRHEPRLTVRILKESYSETAKKLAEKYGDKIYAEMSGEVVTVPEVNETISIRIAKAQIKNNKIVLRWEKNEKASKYKVVIRGSDGKKLIEKTTTKNSATYKVKKCKKYTVKIKGYNKTTGKWQKYTVRTLSRK